MRLRVDEVDVRKVIWAIIVMLVVGSLVWAAILTAALGVLDPVVRTAGNVIFGPDPSPPSPVAQYLDVLVRHFGGVLLFAFALLAFQVVTGYRLDTSIELDDWVDDPHNISSDATSDEYQRQTAMENELTP